MMDKKPKASPKINLAGLVQRIIIMCSIFVLLLYFSQIFNKVVFFALAWIYIFAVIIEGVNKIAGYVAELKKAKA